MPKQRAPTTALTRALRLFVGAALTRALQQQPSHISTFSTNVSALQLKATSRARLVRTYSAPPVIATMQRPDVTIATNPDGSSPKCVADLCTPVAYPIARKEGWRVLDTELAAKLAEESDSETEYCSGESENYSSCELDAEGEKIVAEVEARDAEKLRVAHEAEQARLRGLGVEQGARYERAARRSQLEQRVKQAEYNRLRLTNDDFNAQEELKALDDRNLELHDSNLLSDQVEAVVTAAVRNLDKDLTSQHPSATTPTFTNRTNGASLRNVMHDASAMRLTGWKAMEKEVVAGRERQLPEGGSWRRNASKGDDLRRSLLRKKFSTYKHPVTRAKLFVKQGEAGRAAEHIVRFAGRESRE